MDQDRNKDQEPNQNLDQAQNLDPNQNLGQGPSGEVNSVPSLVEALLFASSRPLPAELIEEVTGIKRKEILGALQDLAEGYLAQGRAFSLEEVAGGYQLRTRAEFAQAVARLHQSRARRRFTRSSLETLAIVAYRQPVSRAEIEHIRGVDSGAVLKGLLAQSMVRVLGRKETPGRPILYGTTREFLEYFGLRDLESLPTLQEVTDLLQEGEQARAAEAGPVREEGICEEFPVAEGEDGEGEPRDEPGDLEGEG